MELDGASVAVSCASGGPGAPISRALAARGAKLTLLARHDDPFRELGSGEIVAGDIRLRAD